MKWISGGKRYSNLRQGSVADFTKMVNFSDPSQKKVSGWVE
jgi:hypothetical protein